MTHLRKLAKPSAFRWASRFGSEEHLEYLKAPIFCCKNIPCCCKPPKLQRSRALCSKEPSLVKWVGHISLKNRLGSTRTVCNHRGSTLSSEKITFFNGTRGYCTEEIVKDPQSTARCSRMVAEGQAALMDYLHCTRGLHFTDAEHMSKHSPIFLAKLLKKVENEKEVGRALTRFFRYHPINEFEPFFESMGLKPSEFNSLLPRDLMFLSDDETLLKNYQVLCDYGIARGKMGRIFKEATEIFCYESGVLDSKLRVLEGLGLNKSSVIKTVASSPILLIGDVNGQFIGVLEWLEDIGIQRDWIGGLLSERNLYNWGRMLSVLQFFSELGFTKKEFGIFIRRHPDFLLDGSGKMVFSLVGLLAKLGGTKREIISLFLRFPDIQIKILMKNLLKGLLFLIEIEMVAEDIQKLLVTHTEVFGLCSLKRPNSILTYLNVGKRRLCRIIKEDPHQLEKYVLGMKVNRLPNSGQDARSLQEKTKFLLRLGFVEDSIEMEKALKTFRGKGDELQDRYNFLVKTGLDPDDVSNMIKMAPHILNQKIDVLESKIDFLVNNLGYPLNSLVAFPSYLSYTTERVKLRFLMYNWLKDRGKVSPALALSSVLACSDKVFTKKFINHHPKGPEVWENFKKAISSS